MDPIIFVLAIPLLFVMLGAVFFLTSRFMESHQAGLYSVHQKKNSALLTRFVSQLALAKTQLFARARRLEELSRKLRLNNEELSRLNNLKMKFLSVATHDIRNPLTAISGYSDLLSKNKNMGPREKRMFSLVVSATGEIRRLIEDLTDLSVIEAGKFKMEIAPFDLAELIRESAMTLAPSAAKKSVNLLIEEFPNEVTVYADRHRIWQVLNNLLGNAVKFTPPGGRVELRASVSAGTLLLAVKDTGPGIQASERKKIFEKFYQSEAIRDAKAKKAGWGLGLAIVQEIVQAHGGTIGVESRGLGFGSTFWVRIPLRPRKAVRAASGLFSSCALMAFLALLAAAPAKAQTLPFIEKTKLEKSLENKTEAVLLNILGPNRAKVVVNATLDFTRTESFQIETASAASSQNPDWPYAWQPPKTNTRQELLPGVPLDESSQGTSQDSQTRSYKRQEMFPANFIKHLDVTLILDNSVNQARSQEVGKIASDLLDLNPKRGDSLTILHAAFSPIWKTVWYSPKTAGMMLKYIMAGFLFLIALLVVSICFLKIANAMRAMAAAQTQQINMDMKGLGDESAPALPGANSETGDSGALLDFNASASSQDSESKFVTFNVEPEQVEALAQMLAQEKPDNIAIVASRLKPSIAKSFLQALPNELSREVLNRLYRIRFIEPEIISSLKEELERRLLGAVGGARYLTELLSLEDQRGRKNMLESVRAQSPELAAELRRRVFFIEDLTQLDSGEWSRLLSVVTYQDWCSALADGPQEVIEALKKNLSERAWGVLSEMIKSRVPSADERRSAENRIAKSVADLAAEGRIKTISYGRSARSDASVPPEVPESEPAAETSTKNLGIDESENRETKTQ